MLKKYSKILICAFALLFSFNLAIASSHVTPIARWYTYSDKSGRRNGMVQIYQSGSTLSGRIVKSFPRKGTKPLTHCKKCTGRLRNAKIVGMRVMWGLKKKAGLTWGSGKIVDPEDGKIYRCKMELSSDGRILKVRGYIGFSLLGRTQTWRRA